MSGRVHVMLSRMSARKSFLAVVLAVATFLVFAGPLRADGDAAAPEHLALEGTSLRVVPPTGAWTQRIERPAPGQWSATFTAEGGEIVVGAIVFPDDGSPPGPREAMLRRAIDTLFVTLRVDGHGVPSARAIRRLGHEGAEGAIEASANGRRLSGRARILAASPTAWAFAWGIARSAVPADVAVVGAFVYSLEPTEARLFTPVFHDPAHDADVALALRAEPPIRNRDIAATLALAEAAFGAPMTLAQRERLGRALQAELPRGPRALRDAVRVAIEAFRPDLGLNAADLAARRRELGLALYASHVARRVDGDATAAAFVDAWLDVEAVLAGGPPDPLRALHVDAGLELAAFLASIAADGPRGISKGERERLHPWWAGRHASADAETRAGWSRLPVLWRRIRHAFDRAGPAERNAFRRDVLALVHGDEAVADLAPDADATVLHAWIAAHPAPGPEAIARRLVDVGESRLLALADRLGAAAVEIPLGW